MAGGRNIGRLWTAARAAGRRHPRLVWASVLVVLLALVASGVGIANAGGGAPAYRTVAAVVPVHDGPGGAEHVGIDTTLYLPASASASSPVPVVIVSPGFGGTKQDSRDDAVRLVGRGYAALTYTPRGFGRSGGKVGLASPDYEIADLRQLIDRLAARSDIRHDGPGDPRVALIGGSYGGGISLLGAAYDRRVDAIVPVITWNSLVSALSPNAAVGPAGHVARVGVFKAQWAAVFLAADTPDTCRKFVEEVCTAYRRIAAAGRLDAAAARLLERRSPAGVIDRIRVPTLLIQGEDDTLFPLAESVRNARGIAANGAPVKLVWSTGGHDVPFGKAENSRINALTGRWLDRWLRGTTSVHTGPVFEWSRSSGGVGSSATLPAPAGNVSLQLARGAREQTAGNPPGGRPASISSLPGAGALTSLLPGALTQIPGQRAQWDTAPLRRGIQLVGTPRVRVRITSTTGSAVLFATVSDVGADGRATLPGGAVAPLRVTGLAPGGTDVDIELPTLTRVVPAGHRLRVTLATTDQGYAAEPAGATYRLTADRTASVLVQTVPAPGGGGYLGLLAVAGGVLLGAAALAVVLVARSRRRARAVSPGRDGAPPVVVRGLTKSYRNGVRAVDGLDLRVERGQVLGLLGPNGAGKTSALRMMVGLVHPSAGEVELFGERVRPGHPVLRRVGTFVEGPGFLPHLSGQDNLRLFWRADARSMHDAHLDEALELAGLGDALDRPVRTYSLGMKGRLAIAQAMLGRPDLLILDEPTNGLDPPQIREMRELLLRVAAAGRTVLISSHQLAEVEQSCTHVAVMDRGRLVAAGSVAELLTGDGGVRVDVAEGAVGPAAEIAARLPGVLSVRAEAGGMLVELDGMARSQLMTALVRAGVPVEGLTTRRRLEDVFLNLVATGPAATQTVGPVAAANGRAGGGGAPRGGGSPSGGSPAGGSADGRPDTGSSRALAGAAEERP